MASAFLSDEDVRLLTGRALKSKQIEQLHRMGIPFNVNAAGRPVVARAVIDKPQAVPQSKREWRPRVIFG